MCSKTAEARRFLQQPKRLNRLIQNKLIEQQQMRDIALSVTAQYGGERVQSSGNNQKMADALGRFVDMESEIDALVDKLINAKRDVANVIEQLPLVEYELIHMVYVQGIDLLDVANDKDKTYSWATTIHGRALKNIQTILESKKTGKLQDI